VKEENKLGFGFKLLAAAALAGLVVQHVFFSPSATAPAQVLAGLVGFLAVMGAGLSARWRAYFGSVLFAVPAMIYVTVFSIIGTLVLQREPAEVFQEKYGRLAGLLEALFFDDIFHSLAFCLILGLTAGSMGLVIVRKRPPGLRVLGSQLAHLGLLLVLAGAGMGQVWGIKGRLDLRVGQQADNIRVQTGRGGGFLPLGFSVRLDDFKIEHYRPDFRLFVYRLSGEKQKKLFSCKPAKDCPELEKLGLSQVGYFPDYAQRVEIEPAQDGQGQGAVQLELSGGEKFWLVEEKFDERVPGLLFLPSRQKAEEYLKATGGEGGPHFLEIAGRRLAVKEAERLELGQGMVVQIKRAFRDFVLDPESKEPAERSEQPNNPALELLVFDSAGKSLGRQFLFARHPEFHGSMKELGEIRYLYLPEAAKARALIVGEERKLWLLEGGDKRESVLAPGEEFTWAGGRARWLDSFARVRERMVEYTRSQEENQPLFRLRLPSGQTADLTPGKPLRLDGEKFAVLAPRGGDTVKDYFSKLSVLEEGRAVKTEVVEVNSPLYHRGFYIYQANYRPDEPDYSGFEVVRDPGLWVVYLGFGLNFAGVVCVLWLARMKKRKESENV